MTHLTPRQIGHGLCFEVNWESHGRDVAAATPYLPGSFDRPPRNIAEKINSGYKAWEWLLYLYGLAPALLFDILPEPYYSHFCKLVRAMRIIQQHRISASDLILADTLLRSFAYEFETLYYQRRQDQLHFCRQVSMLFSTLLQRLQELDHQSAHPSGRWKELSEIWAKRFDNLLIHLQIFLNVVYFAVKSMPLLLWSQISSHSHRIQTYPVAHWTLVGATISSELKIDTAGT
jgi:hypothetical protein